MNNQQLQDLCTQFTDYYYSQFQGSETRNQIGNLYVPTCTLSYNGKTYSGHQGLIQLFSQRFSIGNVQIEVNSSNYVLANDAILLSVLGKLKQQDSSIQTFSQVFLLVNDGQGNFSIMSDIFSVIMK